MASFSLYPWVMTIHGYLSFRMLDDIPNKGLFPPDTQHSLASVIQYDGLHFQGISLDAKNSFGYHVIYDGIYHPENRIRIIRISDPFLNMKIDIKFWKYGMSRLKVYLLNQDLQPHPPL